MSHPDQAACKNLLLGAMSADDYLKLQPHLVRVKLDRDFVLVPTNAPVEHVYFPEDGVVSIVSDRPGKGRTEVGIFGLEGMSATFLLLGATDTPHRSFVQVPGTSALRIGTTQFLQALQQSETLRTTLLRYVHSVMIQVAQSAVTNAQQEMEARLARWLLMCHDRLVGDEIAVTHEFMGMMITAQRSGITLSLHVLEGAGMIRATRGLVIIQNRAKLLELAGEGYGMPEAQYSKLLVPFGKGVRPAAEHQAAAKVSISAEQFQA